LVNPEIPVLSAAQSRDFGIGKFPGSRDSGIPGLQSLLLVSAWEREKGVLLHVSWDPVNCYVIIIKCRQ